MKLLGDHAVILGAVEALQGCLHIHDGQWLGYYRGKVRDAARFFFCTVGAVRGGGSGKCGLYDLLRGAVYFAFGSVEFAVFALGLGGLPGKREE